MEKSKENNQNKIFNIELNIQNHKLLEILQSNKKKICTIFGFKTLDIQNYHYDGNYDGNGTERVLIQYVPNEDAVADEKELLHYLESLSITEAEDSSYDSDCDNNDDISVTTRRKLGKTISNSSGVSDHEQVSRTTSDTLGQEFAEYITSTPCTIASVVAVKQSIITGIPETKSISKGQISSLQSSQAHHNTQTPPYLSSSTSEKSPGYIARVEFALKLGYTERLVQAALARLGPDPAQNELLAELIKLGAQYSSKNDFTCDSPTAECLSLTGNTGANVSGNISGICGSGSGNIGIATGNLSLASSISNSDNSNSLNDDITISSSSSSSIQQVNNILRPIVIDGSNVAMSHGNKEVFSCRGIKLCVDWFKNRGHRDITVFVPKWRKESSRPDNPIKDQDILNELEKERMLVFTPSRLVGGKRMVCYDDRYILKLAVENDGIVVSNDNYRDLVQESSEFKKVVEERVLMYSFVNDRFMPPDDPLGRSGPTLDNFLRIQPKKGDPPPPCPYGKKCTYGNKCKFNHPERGLGPHKSVTERLSEHAARHLSARSSTSSVEFTRIPVQGKSLSVPLNSGTDSNVTERLSRKSLCRTRSGAPDCSATPLNVTKSIPPLSQQSKVQQKQPTNQQPISTTGQQQSSIPGTWESSGCQIFDTHHQHINFPKSHSIENISRDTYFHHSVIGGSHPSNYTTIWSQSVPSPSTTAQQTIEPKIPDKNELVEPLDESVNLHRKLRRQLTLNPAGCDPRIYKLQRCITPSGTSSSSTPSSLIATSQSCSPHRPLAPSLSGPRPTQWDLHQSVTRIASAPDPSRPWHSGPPPASSSEPHINLWPHHTPPSVLAAQDQRRRLHYHLSSIFPEEQVQTVMQMYPDETNPQTICAAILNMFPKI